MTTSDRPEVPSSDRGGRRIERKRGLPGSRAVVGALLVTAAAVGVFAAYLDATATPETAYVVAQGDIPIGTVLTDELVRDTSVLATVAMDLPPDVADAAVPADAALGLVGQRTTAPLGRGDLVSSGFLADAELDDDTVSLSFQIDRARAVGGTLEAGERVDVAVTHGQGAEAYTSYVARNVLVTRQVDAGGGLEGEAVIVTLALPDDERVLAIVQATNTGQVVVTRAAAGAGERGAAVPPYAPAPTPGEAEAVPSLPAGVSPAADPEG